MRCIDAKVLKACYERLVVEHQHELQRQIDLGESAKSTDSVIAEKDAKIADLEKQLAAKPKATRKKPPAQTDAEVTMDEPSVLPEETPAKPKRTRKKKATPPAEEDAE